MNQAKPAYDRALHNVRRVKPIDFDMGFKLRPGVAMAADGSWQRKAIITAVIGVTRGATFHTCHSRNVFPDWVGYKCRVVNAGRYWADGRYAAPKRPVRSIVTVWFNGQGRVMTNVPGMVPVVPCA